MSVEEFDEFELDERAMKSHIRPGWPVQTIEFSPSGIAPTDCPTPLHCQPVAGTLVLTGFPTSQAATIPTAMPKYPVGSRRLWTDYAGEFNVRVRSNIVNIWHPSTTSVTIPSSIPAAIFRHDPRKA
jgi:hypothetical protein